MSRDWFRMVWREAARGKSIGRVLANEALRQWRGKISGIVLDLACGRAPSYRRILGLKESNETLYLVGVDYNPAFRPTVVADLTRSLPFKDEVADVVMLMSFLYIPSDPCALLREVNRVLKSGGLFLISAPLVFPYTPEPTDYWRFTEEGLQLLLERSGFVKTEVIPVGDRFSAAVYVLEPFLRPRWLVAPIVYWIAMELDSWARRLRLPKCPIGYVVKAEKL